MNIAMSTAERQATKSKPGQELSWHRPADLWTVQGCGLIVLTFLCFFPRLSHVGEYVFLALVLTAIVGAWLYGEKVVLRTPLDVPLLLFVGWVLVTVPFATDPAYSFAEWRKLATKILSFYWAFRVLQAQPNRTVTRGILAAV
ncbi:MAG TPA: hypothetical protein VJ692_13010, partial [Nitrospiraceae bacterium]|nr:hypothetical protein [Nitrospiraceae bacterium]